MPAPPRALALALALALVLGALVRLSVAALRGAELAAIGQNSLDDPFLLWLDFPGSPAYEARRPQWYDKLLVQANVSFISMPSSRRVDADYGYHGGIHLFANPAFQQERDDRIRQVHGKQAARDSTGVPDKCQWPSVPPAKAPASAQYWRRTKPLVVDFADGLDPSELVLALTKGCCAHNRSANVGVERDVVGGVEQNVLRLTAWNADNGSPCPGPDCHKLVTSNAAVATADLFASARYTVVAKVPPAKGLVWAVWTFHYEEHLPHDCSLYTCYCSGMPNTTVMIDDECEFRDGFTPCKFSTTCDDNTDGWDPSGPLPPPTISPAACGASHATPDPQFLDSYSFAGYKTIVNHEIDIEIPASSTCGVCTTPSPVPGANTCAGDYSTLNMNNYIYTSGSGTGPAYSNMCAKGYTDAAGSQPMALLGDGEYHNYTFLWHTGNGTDTPGRVDFLIDDVYMGTNNAFAPTRGSRLYIAHWPPVDKNALWAGRPDDWGGGTPGDGKEYSVSAYVARVEVAPFDEPNDMMYPSIRDQPNGCTPPYNQRYDVCNEWEEFKVAPPAARSQ